MKSRICLLTLVVLCASLSPAFARSWTDNQGKRIVATFKEVYWGNVFLTQGTKTIAVPFFNLSKRDRDYVEEQLEKSGKTDQLPKLGEKRVWTDTQGRAIEAQLIGMQKRKVVVLQNDKVVEYSFSTFSVEDQEYVKEQMDERGQGNLVPAIVRPSAKVEQRPERGCRFLGYGNSRRHRRSSVRSQPDCCRPSALAGD